MDRNNILLIDDAKEFKAVMEKGLKLLDLPCNFIFADCTNSALRVLKETRVSLIISDLKMPAEDGFQLRRRIIKQEICKNIPFVILSGSSLKSEIPISKQLAISDFYLKPSSYMEMIRVVKTIIEKYLNLNKS